VKRFVAGASCPSCGQIDSLYFESKQQDQVFCSRCNYQAKRASEIDKEPDHKKDSDQEIKWH
jgi:uncharacterized metal-binding protein (TIGR02443 family)